MEKCWPKSVSSDSCLPVLQNYQKLQYEDEEAEVVLQSAGELLSQVEKVTIYVLLGEE